MKIKRVSVYCHDNVPMTWTVVYTGKKYNKTVTFSRKDSPLWGDELPRKIQDFCSNYTSREDFRATPYDVSYVYEEEVIL